MITHFSESMTGVELLRWVDSECVAGAHGQGYQWFWQKFLPSLQAAATLGFCEAEIIAGCFYVAGDVHDFNDAPKAAIRCYEKALEHDPYIVAAHREIASMHERMGNYREAAAHLQLGLQIDPTDEELLQEREYLDPEDKTEPLFLEGDAIWASSELLAERKPLEALRQLDDRDDLLSEKAKTRCLGALGDSKAFVNAWSKLCTHECEIELEYGDWFFIPEDVYHNEAFWNCLLTGRAKFKGVMACDEGLGKNELFRSLPPHRQNQLYLEVWAYKALKKTDELSKLASEYPELNF